jgi:predicted restriction endonuclease
MAAGCLLMASRGTDKFGFRLGTKRARGAELYEGGATQAEITAAIGYPLYNMLKDAARRGHRVVREGNRFWLRHAYATDDTEADVEQIQNRGDLTETERASLIQARRGQGRYRKQVMELGGGRCAVTGCSVGAVVEACHLKPWGISSRLEQLDPENGLCLVANLHKLFDAGLITFDDEGLMRVSGWLSPEDQMSLKLEGRMRIRSALTAKQKTYLRFHRETIFLNDG